MNRLIPILAFSLLFLLACNKNESETPDAEDPVKSIVSAVDVSSYPEISASKPAFFDAAGKNTDFLDILKKSGVNTIRLRLWVDPANGHCGFDEVKQFSQTLKAKGFKTWLTVHYSDTWADPGKQETPEAWATLDLEALKLQVYRYTYKVVSEMEPDFIQIGNEVNSGFLHPQGSSANFAQFRQLLAEGMEAARDADPGVKIMIHFAGIDGANQFFNKIDDLDFDLIGLSYYPWWHGTNLTSLGSTIQQLGTTYEREVLIAETAYPFTLEWNDWTDNIVGLENQLLKAYPASPAGQQRFVAEIKTQVLNNTDCGLGFCYWGGELIAWKGSEAKDASPWENLALFDFSNKALPVLNEFNIEK